MIRHVVLLKLDKNAPLETIKEKILQLSDTINIIKHIEVGIDIGFDPTSSDICIIADFNNTDDLEIYAKHPKHIEVIQKYIKPYLIQRSVVDYNVI